MKHQLFSHFSISLLRTKYLGMNPTVLKKIMIAASVLGLMLLLAAVVCYFVMEGWRQLFFSFAGAILALNMFFIFFMARTNYRKLARKGDRT